MKSTEVDGIPERIEAERERILNEYSRRSASAKSERYSPDNPVERFMVSRRVQRARQLLDEAGVVLDSGTKCLEIGYGRGGWIPDLMDLGSSESNISGIELDETRARVAIDRFPLADLQIGDATSLPWNDGAFDLIVVSTVFSSILDPLVKRVLADEIVRALAPKGVVIWYDLAFNNPANQNVRGIKREEVTNLFPSLDCKLRRVTLAPPIARAVVPISEKIGAILDGLPLLRSHLIGSLVPKT